MVYSEDFNNLGFENPPVAFGDSFSDKYTLVDYYSINNFDGWIFSGPGTQYAVNRAGTDGAITLNEWGPPTSASTIVTGLNPGETYKLSLLVYGDNAPGENWGLDVAVNGLPLLQVLRVDQQAGTNPGTTENLLFKSAGTSATLFFSQCCSTQFASPIFDNVQVSTTPLPAGIWLLAPALGGLGYMRRRTT